MYALLFLDTGLSAAAISSLFTIWSLTAFALEVPSGAWADTVSRRHLLAGAGVLRAAGFALWILFPSYAAFAAGFVLWGIGSALSSGTQEALVYDELALAGATEVYPRLMGRAGMLRLLGMGAMTAAATPLMIWGGYALTGWVSVGISVAGGLLALTFPVAPRAVDPESDDDDGSYVQMLKAGLREVAGRSVLRAAVLLAALLPGLYALDEYLPLFAEHAAGAAFVPLLTVVLIACEAAGSGLAGRFARASSGRVAVLLGLGALGIAGAVLGGILGYAVVCVGVGLLRLGWVLVDARLQDAVTGRARATVTSVAGFGAELAAMLTFGGYALGSSLGFSVPTLVAVFAAPLAVLALAARRWLPPPAPLVPAAPVVPAELVLPPADLP